MTLHGLLSPQAKCPHALARDGQTPKDACQHGGEGAARSPRPAVLTELDCATPSGYILAEPGTAPSGRLPPGALETGGLVVVVIKEVLM